MGSGDLLVDLGRALVGGEQARQSPFRRRELALGVAQRGLGSRARLATMGVSGAM